MLKDDWERFKATRKDLERQMMLTADASATGSAAAAITEIQDTKDGEDDR